MRKQVKPPSNKEIRWEQKIAFDPKLKRPANPELQRKFKCASTVSYLFPKETWLSTITANLLVLLLTEEEIEELIQNTMENSRSGHVQHP